ncbi:MAG: CDP-alcohol phosphatidyltransferase family protein [Candidatus Colwellbacteria bacterium]|nr:CDP-alcohol phosphatidyltransferase family protein [Candidatus Colwellbacteria bacterium]
MDNRTQPRKLPNHLECPFDILLYKIIEPLSNLFHTLNFTPNMLTTISTIFGALAFYFLYKRREELFVGSLILYYLFDCLDGYYARKYGMCTKFGDYYDHVKDLIVALTVIGLIFYRLYRSKNYKSMIALGVACATVFIQMSCQESFTGQNVIPMDHPCHGHTLQLFASCPPEEWRNTFRFFGVGFFIVFLSILVWYTKAAK